MAEEKDRDFENQNPDLENINTENHDAAAESHDSEAADAKAAAEDAAAEDAAAEAHAEEEIQVSVDEEWAETLHINFDPSRLRQTPPPIPGVPLDQQIPEIPVQHSPLMDLPHADHQQPGYQQPQPGFAPQPQPQPSIAQQPGIAPQPQPEFAQQHLPEMLPMPKTYLVPTIIITILCCTIPGIVALFFSSKVTSRYYMGDYAGAERASRNAEKWLIASVVLGAVSAAVYIPLFAL